MKDWVYKFDYFIRRDISIFSQDTFDFTFLRHYLIRIRINVEVSMSEFFSYLPLGRNSAMEASPINFMKNKDNKMKSLSNLPLKYAGFFYDNWKPCSARKLLASLKYYSTNLSSLIIITKLSAYLMRWTNVVFWV
jgi:hypothetical protein